MKITETRKAIIELIEHYMDKTLSEGCLLYINECWMYKNSKKYYDIILDTEETQEKEEGECLILYMKKGEITVSKNIINVFNGDKNLRNSRDYTIKIIGHYDITAVFKYCIDKGCFSENFSDTISIWRGVGDGSGDIDFFIEIPSKPLHLYTEEEDKQLLDLLLKLK